MGVDGSVHFKTPKKGKEEYIGEEYKLVGYEYGKILRAFDYPTRCENVYDFIHYAQRRQDTWNAGRPNFGINMNGLTPLDKLKEKHILCPENLLHFPVLLLEDFFPFYKLLTRQYVLTNYQKSKENVFTFL